MVPGVILRWRYPPEKVAANFFVEFMSPTSLDIRLEPPTPTARLYLRFVNLSPAWVEIERTHVELQVTYQQLVTFDDHERYRVKQFSAVPPIKYGFDGMYDPKVYIEMALDSGRAGNALDQLKRQPSGDRVQMKVSVYGRCQTGRFEKTELQWEIPTATAGIRT